MRHHAAARHLDVPALQHLLNTNDSGNNQLLSELALAPAEVVGSGVSLHESLILKNKVNDDELS